MNTGMFRVEFLCGDFVMFDVRVRYARTSTLPYREWLSFSLYIKEIHIESICFSLFSERKIQERQIYLILENIVLYFQDLVCSIVFLKNKSCSFLKLRYMSIYYYYIDRYWNRFQESNGYRLLYLLVLGSISA